MLRNLASIVGFALIQMFSTAAFAADLAPQRKPKPCLREQ